MAPIAVGPFMIGATIASRYAPAIESCEVAALRCRRSMCREAAPLVMAWVTIELESRLIGSIPEAPRSSRAMRRGMPEGSASTSWARRARITVQTCLSTSMLIDEGSRLAVPRARLKS